MDHSIKHFILNVEKISGVHVQKLSGYGNQDVSAFSVKYKMICIAYIFQCNYGIGFSQIENGKLQPIRRLKTHNEIKEAIKWCSKRTRESIRYRKSIINYKLAPSFINFLYGLLIGDGCLVKVSKYSAYYCQSCKFKEPLLKIQDMFKDNRMIGNIEIINGGYNFKTYSYTYLFDIYNRWYLSNFYLCPLCEVLFNTDTYDLANWKTTKIHRKCPICKTSLVKKIIPIDFSINSVTLKWLFYGDGSFSGGRVAFSTCGFLRNQNKLFVNSLNNIVGVNALYSEGINIIHICNKKGIKKFFEYIGACDLECYEYKWLKEARI